jgi:uncharacterized delta-60 repeat protein
MLMPLGILSAQVALSEIYRLQTIGGTLADDGNGVAVDSQNNIYTVGSTRSAGAGNFDLLLVKFDFDGVIQWQRVLGGGSLDQGYSVEVDSADNVYVIGDTSSAGAGGADFLIAKYNSSGTIQWQRAYGTTSGESGAAIALDSADNVYALGSNFSISPPFGSILFAKYNSSGTIQLQRSLHGASDDFGQGAAVDSADNFYLVGSTASAGPGFSNLVVAKYNSSGTIQWQRVLGGAGGSTQASNVAIDSVDNIYAVGLTSSTGAGGQDVFIAKYDSSGTLQWQRVLGGSGNESAFDVAVDAFDNVYVIGQTASAGAGANDFLIAKYDSSGTIQWQRVLGGSLADSGRGITLDSDENIYAVGSTASAGAGGNDVLIAVLPNDGSLTGTYAINASNIIYQASSLTAATSSLTSSALSLASNTRSFTSTSTSLTSAAASLTENRVNL